MNVNQQALFLLLEDEAYLEILWKQHKTTTKHLILGIDYLFYKSESLGPVLVVILDDTVTGAFISDQAPVQFDVHWLLYHVGLSDSNIPGQQQFRFCVADIRET